MMKEFIFTHYKELIVGVVFIFEFISSLILLIKKSKKETSTFSLFLSLLPKLISKAEVLFGSGNGEKKKEYVLNSIKAIMTGYGIGEDKLLIQKLSEQIELILSTPEKKEVKDEDKK